MELGAGARILVILDEGGVGKALVKQLAKAGANVLAVEAATADRRPARRRRGLDDRSPLTGVYWLPALDDEGDQPTSTWPAGARPCAVASRSLYARCHAGLDAKPFLVTATRLGGCHGYDAAGATNPLGGAVVGFAKSYRRSGPTRW